MTAPRPSQAPQGAQSPGAASVSGPDGARPPQATTAPREPTFYDANRALFEELDRETQAAIAAADTDMDAWATHAGRAAEIHEELARLAGWRTPAPRHDEEYTTMPDPTPPREGCVHEGCWYPACAAPTEVGGTLDCCATQACGNTRCPGQFPYRIEETHA